MSDGSIPSPFSTGGGGYKYEQMVGATYLAAMVCGDAAPGVDGTVTEVRFQQRRAGHLLDDLVVVFKDDNEHRLSLQVKYNLQVGTSHDFKDVIANCWQMFAGGEGIAFDRAVDRLGVVVPRVSRDAHYHYLPVLEMARSSADSDAFWSNLKLGGYSKHRLEFTNFVKSAVMNYTGSDVTDEKLWKFFKTFYVIVLDMGGLGSVGLAFTAGMCLRALARPSEGEKAKLLGTLREVAAELASIGGSITTAVLKGRLSAFYLRGHAKTAEDIESLDKHSQAIMDGIKETIAKKIALNREPLLERLGEMTTSNGITIIYGAPFAGKSALAKLFTEKVSRKGTVIFFDTEHFGNTGNLVAFLRSIDVHGRVDEILETHGSAPHRYVIIDDFDRLSYEAEKMQVVEDLLEAISGYNESATMLAAGGDTSWKIIVTTREIHLENTISTVLHKFCGHRPATLEVSPLNDKDILEIRRQAPQLAGIIKGRPAGLLSLPGYLDMVARRLLVSAGDTTGPVGEGWLYHLLWKEAVLNRGGMRKGAGHGQIRERLLMDMAERAHKGLPPTDMFDLDQAAVDSLLAEDLARKVGNRLAFAHDVIEDYALARLIERAESRRSLLEADTGRRRLIRPLRICAAKMLEADASEGDWESLLEDCRRLKDGDEWALECLLGVADSDAARSSLDVIDSALLKDDGALLAKLLAALPNAFMRDNPHPDQAVTERGIVDPGLQPEPCKLPRYERFAPILLFALDNIPRLGDAATAQFIRTAAMWSRSGTGRDLKRRIAEHAAQHMDWLRSYDAILGQDYAKSSKTKALVAATVLYSSDSAPDLVRELILDNPSIISNEHFKRGLIEEYGWVNLCKFLPDVAVDVLSRIMCADIAASGLLQNISRAHNDRWTDLASPYEGPFYTFLVLCSEHGLDLVHKVLNRATDLSCREQKAGRLLHSPRTLLPQTVDLGSGPVDVYGDEYAFAWCGHAFRAQDLVASALMALELWLDEQVEHGKAPPAALFDRVLRETRSAAVVGVCCAVALRHMGESAEAVLPMLANPAFWIMDERRLEADIQAGSIIRAQSIFHGRGPVLKEKYKLAIQRADARPKLGRLNAFAAQILIVGPDEARENLQEALKAFPDRVPVLFKEDADDEKTMSKRRRYCMMLSKQAYSDNYTYSAASDRSIKISIAGGRSHTGDEKSRERQALARKKAEEFIMWLNALIEENKVGPSFTDKSALEYTTQVVTNSLLPFPPGYHADDAANIRANLAGAMIIHRWDDAVKVGAANDCLGYIEDMADIIDPRNKDESPYPYGADRAVALALPHCYLRGGRGRGTRKAIHKFADAYSAEVLESLMRGLRVLWGHEDKIVLECIAKARRRFRSKEDWLGHPYEDWTRYAALLSAVHGVPPANDDTEGKLRHIVDNMLDDTISAFKDFEGDPDYGASYLSFHKTWCPVFFRTLESYAAARPALRGGILAKIASNWEAAPPLLESFMRWTLLWGLVAGRRKNLLSIWKGLLPAVINSKSLAGYHNDRAKKSILALLIFADSQSTVKNEEKLEMVGEFTDEISSWCAAFAGNMDAVEAIASVLNDAPPQLLLSHGIGWLWQVLQTAEKNDIPDHTVKLLSDLLRKASTCKRPSGTHPSLHDKYAWLVDYLASLDPDARPLNYEGKNPYAGAGGGDGGDSYE